MRTSVESSEHRAIRVAGGNGLAHVVDSQRRVGALFHVHEQIEQRRVVAGAGAVQHRGEILVAVDDEILLARVASDGCVELAPTQTSINQARQPISTQRVVALAAGAQRVAADQGVGDTVRDHRRHGDALVVGQDRR